METVICLVCHQLFDEQVILHCKHPVCSKCLQVQSSFALLHKLCDQVVAEHIQENKECDEKKTANIFCPICNEKTILIFSQGDIILSNNQQLSAVNDGLGENQQQQYIPDEMFRWIFQFLDAKILFTKVRFTCQRVDKIVSSSLHSFCCQKSRINVLKFAKKFLPKETQLQELNLMSSNIDNNGVIEIATVFPLMQQLQILDLSWNKIGDPGATAIANSITNLTQLQWLYLHNNQIGDTGATTIANSIRNLTQLQQLDLGGNQIGDSGAVAIANVASNLIQLLGLYLNHNRIGCTGAIAIAKSISKLTHLQQLYLNHNQIGDSGATAIANAVSNLTKLNCLYLWNGKISEPVKQQLKQQLGCYYKLYI